MSVVLVACGDDVTAVRLGVAVEPAWGADRVQIRVGGRSGPADPVSVIEVLLPDTMAGAPQRLELWALTGLEQIAYGTIELTPQLHDYVHGDVSLARVTCGSWCEPGTVKCQGDGIARCVQQDNGCAAWSAIDPCPADARYCSNGACAAVCVDECGSDEVGCDTDFSTKRCGEADSDPCRDWLIPMTCGSGQTCGGGICAGTSVCTETSCRTAPQPTCVSTSKLRTFTGPGTCGESGCEFAAADTDCPHGCSNGACNQPPVYAQVSAGGDFTCAVMTDDSIRCWGKDQYGQASPPAGAYTHVTTGWYHACALRRDRTITCWGRNDHDQLAAPRGAYLAIDAGANHTCAIRTNGAVECWGYDHKGQASPPLSSYKRISAGDEHACAVQFDDTVRCWGDNATNQSAAPTGTFVDVTAGDFHSCGMRPTGTVVCWGLDQDSLSPVSQPTGTFKAVSAGRYWSCGVRSVGTLVCWDHASAVEAPPSNAGTSFNAITVGLDHACALRAGGQLVCWGDNGAGQASPP